MEKNLPFTPETAYEAAARLYHSSNKFSLLWHQLDEFYIQYMNSDRADDFEARQEAGLWLYELRYFMQAIDPDSGI